jgi:adenylate cyclase class IV
MTESPPRRNLELKARHAELAAAREAMRQLGAQPGGIERQTDTFFLVPWGRLKLREIEGQPAALIWYERPDAPGIRTSNYRLVPAPDPAGLKSALRAALGVRGRVVKSRDIFFWHNVRIHLDDVTGLGTFVELEAVLSDEDGEAISLARLDRLCEALAIVSSDALAPAYADLLGL